MNKSSQKKRIHLPVFGDQETSFFTKGKLRVAQGYEKIVFQKKPVVQFSTKNIFLENFYVPFHMRWTEEREESPFIEYRTKDYCKIKVLYCKLTRMFFCRLADLDTKTNFLKVK